MPYLDAVVNRVNLSAALYLTAVVKRVNLAAYALRGCSREQLSLLRVPYLAAVVDRDNLTWLQSWTELTLLRMPYSAAIVNRVNLTACAFLGCSLEQS